MTGRAVRVLSHGGASFAVLEWGPADGELALLLHGFPDTPHTFSALAPRLADAGFCVVAPFMRGYAPSPSPADGDLSVRALAADVVALIGALGRDHAVIVGHDWGAVATYLAATLTPGRVRRFVAAAVPPPRALIAGLTPAQLWRSSYMAAFQVPGVPERILSANDFAAVRALWRRWSPGWAFTDSDFEPVARCFSTPGSLSNALGYYRALPRSIAFDREGRRAAFGKIQVPGLVVAGATDGCMGIDLMLRSAVAFGGCGRFEVIEDAGHFMHRESPDRFAELTLSFLRG